MMILYHVFRDFDGSSHHVAEITYLLLEFDLAADDSGDIQQVVYQPNKVAGLPLDNRALANKRRVIAHLVTSRAVTMGASGFRIS